LQLARLVEHEMQTRVLVQDLREKISQYVLYDSISGLPNQQLFVRQLDSRLAREKNRPVLTALVRLDRFEQVHKALGKTGVDHLIAEAVNRVNDVAGPLCLMGHVREDTLAIAFHYDRAGSRDSLIAELLQRFRSAFLLGEHQFLMRLQIGAAIFPDDGTDAATLLKRARTALSQESSATTSAFRFYNRELSEEAARRFEIEGALKEALERDELEIVYQPKIGVLDRRLAGAEALLRWNNERLGAVSPAEFIPIAEECGLSTAIGAWVLERACRQVVRWQKSGNSCPEFSVNISNDQLRLEGFCEQVRDILTMTGLAGSSLNLEITEGSLIENIDQAIGIMEQLRGLGVQLSIDDFGTGFSSLSYLRRMPVQVLKIDASFIRDVGGRPASAMLVDSIIAMGHALQLRIVAEGVETQAQLRYLRSAGCDLVQGFVFSPPLNPERFAARFLGSTGLRCLTQPELAANAAGSGRRSRKPLLG
jgi:predicted signal transduction protein with EAL and GGDEF domain